MLISIMFYLLCGIVSVWIVQRWLSKMNVTGEINKNTNIRLQLQQAMGIIDTLAKNQDQALKINRTLTKKLAGLMNVDDEEEVLETLKTMEAQETHLPRMNGEHSAEGIVFFKMTEVLRTVQEELGMEAELAKKIKTILLVGDQKEQ